GEGAGRSTVPLRAGAMAALERVGWPAAVLAGSLAMRGRMMHARAGQLAFQAYSADGSKAITSISRRDLNALLLDAAAAEEKVSICFEARAVGARPDAGALTL